MFTLHSFGWTTAVARSSRPLVSAQRLSAALRDVQRLVLMGQLTEPAMLRSSSQMLQSSIVCIAQLSKPTSLPVATTSSSSDSRTITTHSTPTITTTIRSGTAHETTVPRHQLQHIVASSAGSSSNTSYQRPSAAASDIFTIARPSTSTALSADHSTQPKSVSSTGHRLLQILNAPPSRNLNKNPPTIAATIDSIVPASTSVSSASATVAPMIPSNLYICKTNGRTIQLMPIPAGQRLIRTNQVSGRTPSTIVAQQQQQQQNIRATGHRQGATNNSVIINNRAQVSIGAIDRSVNSHSLLQQQQKHNQKTNTIVIMSQNQQQQKHTERPNTIVITSQNQQLNHQKPNTIVIASSSAAIPTSTRIMHTSIATNSLVNLKITSVSSNVTAVTTTTTGVHHHDDMITAAATNKVIVLDETGQPLPSNQLHNQQPPATASNELTQLFYTRPANVTAIRAPAPSQAKTENQSIGDRSGTSASSQQRKVSGSNSGPQTPLTIVAYNGTHVARTATVALAQSQQQQQPQSRPMLRQLLVTPTSCSGHVSPTPSSSSCVASTDLVDTTTLEQMREFDMVFEQMKETNNQTINPTTPPPAVFSGRPPMVHAHSAGKPNSVPSVVRAAAAQKKKTLHTTGDDNPLCTATSSGSPATSTPNSKQSYTSTSSVADAAAQSPFKLPAIPLASNVAPPARHQEDEQTVQRIYDILAEYAEQLRNSPDLNNKPAPRRRANNLVAPAGSTGESPGTLPTDSSTNATPSKTTTIPMSTPKKRKSATSSAKASPQHPRNNSKMAAGILDNICEAVSTGGRKSPPSILTSASKVMPRPTAARQIMFDQTGNNTGEQPATPQPSTTTQTRSVVINTTAGMDKLSTAVLMPDGKFVLPAGTTMIPGQTISILTNSPEQRQLHMQQQPRQQIQPPMQKQQKQPQASRIVQQGFVNDMTVQSQEKSRKSTTTTHSVSTMAQPAKLQLQQQTNAAIVKSKSHIQKQQHAIGNHVTISQEQQPHVLNTKSAFARVPQQHQRILITNTTSDLPTTSSPPPTTAAAAPLIRKVWFTPMPQQQRTTILEVTNVGVAAGDSPSPPPSPTPSLKRSRSSVYSPMEENSTDCQAIVKRSRLHNSVEIDDDTFDMNMYINTRVEADGTAAPLATTNPTPSVAVMQQIPFNSQPTTPTICDVDQELLSEIGSNHEFEDLKNTSLRFDTPDSPSLMLDTSDLQHRSSKLCMLSQSYHHHHSSAQDHHPNESTTCCDGTSSVTAGSGTHQRHFGQSKLLSAINEAKQRRQMLALAEREICLQKSLSEECEDLGVDEPSASDLFPEAELPFDSGSPAFDLEFDLGDSGGGHRQSSRNVVFGGSSSTMSVNTQQQTSNPNGRIAGVLRGTK